MTCRDHSTAAGGATASRPDDRAPPSAPLFLCFAKLHLFFSFSGPSPQSVPTWFAWSPLCSSFLPISSCLSHLTMRLMVRQFSAHENANRSTKGMGFSSIKKKTKGMGASVTAKEDQQAKFINRTTKEYRAIKEERSAADGNFGGEKNKLHYTQMRNLSKRRKRQPLGWMDDDTTSCASN